MESLPCEKLREGQHFIHHFSGMGDAYVGAGAERITYCGVLYQIPGRFCGELPDMRMVACGECESEVRATLQGLLEEAVETILDDNKILPQPVFDQLEGAYLSTDAMNAQIATFTVAVPSTVSKDLLSSFSDYSQIYRNPRLREMQFVAVVLLMEKNNYGGHFPDLPGAFTSGRSQEETCARLQRLLEIYVGGLVRDGAEVPPPKFASLSDLQMTKEELNQSPVVCMHKCVVEIPT